MNRNIFKITIKDTAARWSSKGLTRTRFLILGVTLTLTFLPFWLLSGSSTMRAYFGNDAQAAVDARQSVETTSSAKPYRNLSARLRNDRDELLGLTIDDVKSALSRPQLMRRDGPIEIWQYRTANCVLDLYFDTRGDAATVAHYELRAREKAMMVSEGLGLHMVNQKSCMKNLLNGQSI